MDESVKPIEYNYEDKETMENNGVTYRMSGEQSGLSVFYTESGNVFHTYSTYGRGGEAFLSTYHFLDVTPLGRQEPEHGEAWGRIDAFLHHDKYTVDSYTGAVGASA